MVYPPTPRSEFVGALAAEILHNYSRGRVIVGIDGALGAASLADDLAVELAERGHAVFRASFFDFLRPRAARTVHGVNSPDAYYSDWFDYSVYLRVLVQPFRMGGSAGFVTAAFDAARDTPREARWLTAPQDAMLVVDGPFLQRPELKGTAHFVAYLDTPQGAVESGLLDEQQAAADQMYETAVGPRMLADAIVSVADEAAPKRVFADRC